MVQITIDLPEELGFMRKVPSIAWTIAVSKVMQSKIEETSRFLRIVSKSKASEKDVEELTERINSAWKENS